MADHCFRIAKSSRALRTVAVACAFLAASGMASRANASSLGLFDTGGTTLGLTMYLDDATGSLLGGDVRGLAGILVTNPFLPNGLVIGDFGLTTLPSTLIFGLDAATLTQGVGLLLDVFNWRAGGPGILIPVTAIPQTPITDPAMLDLLSGPIVFGFAFTGVTDSQGLTSVSYTLASATVGAPEPAAWLLMAFGLVGITVSRQIKARWITRTRS